MPSCPFCHRDVPDQATICPHCLRSQPVVIPAARPSTSPARDAMHGRWRLLGLLVLLAGVAAFGWRHYKSLPPDAYSPDTSLPAAPEPAPQVVQTTIAPPLDVPVVDSASAQVPAGGYLAFPFSGGGRTECHLKGAIRVLSGGDRRVTVVVVDREGLGELEAGRTPRTWYDSGPVSDASLDFKVDGRTSYNLVVLNTGARGRAKQARLGPVVAACAD